MRILSALLSPEAVAAAVDAEASFTRSLMPPSQLQPVLMSRSKDVADWALRRLSGEFSPEPQQVVTVRKTRHGVRPVGELFLRDRIAYRTLVEAWSDELDYPDRSRETFRKFEEGPFTDDWFATYVVSSDITAFYQYVDYELLSRELVAQTGDADRVDTLVALLTSVTGQRFGLPQQSQPSDVLAEAYIDVLERRMVRHGYQIRRYNDDFRISVADWREALAAVDALDREARALGLALNDSKTVIRKVSTYQDVVHGRDTLLQAIAEEAELDLADAMVQPYDPFMFVPLDADDVQQEAALRILRRWKMEDPDEPGEHALVQLVPLALNLLAGSPVDDEVLSISGELLVREQSVTPAVARLLEHLPVDNEESALRVIDDLLTSNPYLTPWQVSWLAPALSRLPSFAAGSTGAARGAWLKSTWADSRAPEPVRASVAQALARHKVIKHPEIIDAFDSMSETNQAVLAGALGSTGLAISSRPAAAIVKDDDLIRWMFEWGSKFA